MKCLILTAITTFGLIGPAMAQYGKENRLQNPHIDLIRLGAGVENAFGLGNIGNCQKTVKRQEEELKETNLDFDRRFEEKYKFRLGKDNKNLKNNSDMAQQYLIDMNEELWSKDRSHDRRTLTMKDVEQCNRSVEYICNHSFQMSEPERYPGERITQCYMWNMIKSDWENVETFYEKCGDDPTKPYNPPPNNWTASSVCPKKE